MKSKVFLALASAALLFAGCAKDQALYDKVDDLDKRVSVLEEQVKELNEKTVPGLQATVAAIQNGVLVSKVVKTSEGYTIYFSDGTTAVLKNGDKGEAGNDAVAPVVSAKEVDGVFYWTVNGEIMKDADGNPVRVYSALPQFRINEGKWEVSYDEGATWTVVEVMGDAKQLPITIVDADDHVTFYIGEEAYEIKKEVPFYLTINVTDRKGVAVPQGEEYLYDYTLTGVQEGDEVEVDILSITAGWEARVVSLPQGDKPGWIGVKNLDNSDGKVFIYASNGKGKTDIKSLVFEGGVFEAEMDVQTIPAEGGEAVLTVVTNIDYELWKDPTAKWLTIADTKAVHTDVITLVAEPNTTGAYRSAEVDVLLQNTEEAYMVLQYPSQEEVTSISSLANVDNYVSVTLYNEPVVAASQYSVVVSDGTANLYVPYDHFDIGTILNITGFNSPDGFTVTNVEVVGEGGEVVETAFNYYGYGQIYSNIFTAYNGTLVVEEGVYMLQNDYGEDGIVSVIIEAPVESLGFADMTPGNIVAAKGYIVGYMDGENEGDQMYMMVAADANEAVFAETGTITYSNAGGDSFLWDYDKPYIQYAIYNSKIWDSFETKEEIVLYTAKTEADDYQYDFLHSYSSLFSPAELAPLVLYSVGEPVQMSSELPYGEYVVVAVSMDEYGRLQGPYGYLEMEKVEPETPKNAYEDFLGKWVVGNGTMSIDQDVAGESYKINGLFSMSATYGSSELSAQFVDGKLVIMEQLLGKWENTNYGMCSTYFTGLFKSGSSVYPHYTGADGNAKAPAQAVIAYVEDGKLNFIGGASEYSSNMIGYAVRWIIDEGANAGAGNWIYNGTKSANLPQAFDKAKEASEGYKKWLGSYTASPMDLGDDKGISMPITLSEGVADETIFINGLGIDGVPAKYVASTGNLQLIYNTPISASGTYEFVVAGTTNDGYVATGDENGVVAEFTMDADGKITAVSNPWYISDERPEVFASAFGVRGKKIADGGWVHFSDVADFVNPATLVKASTKSTSHNSVDALKLDNKLVQFENVKVAKKTSKVEKTPAQVKSVNFAKRTLSK